MKSPISRIICAVMMILMTGSIKAQITADPLVSAAVTTNTVTLDKILSSVNTKQLAIAAENALILAQVDSIRKYENIMYGYLKKAHNIFGDLQQIAECVELGSNIVTETGKCISEAAKNPANTFLSSVASEMRRKIITESISLTNTITTLIKGSGDKNLINSAERLQILYNIHYQLTALYQDIKDLRWHIMNYNWIDDFNRSINYSYLTAQERALQSSKRRIDALSKFFE